MNSNEVLREAVEWMLSGGNPQQMKSDYEVNKASRETREAMADRCATQGHDYENCCSVAFQIYQKCKWCGQTR